MTGGGLDKDTGSKARDIVNLAVREGQVQTVPGGWEYI